MAKCTYDYIFAGSGAAALSLLLRMQDKGLLNQKKILLADRAPKNKNDRTWCFWEKGDSYFESVVYHSWGLLNFYSKDASLDLAIHPYRYKMIRGIDFFRYCLERLQGHSGIDFRYGELKFEPQGEHESRLWIGEEEVDTTGAMVFSSLYSPEPVTPREVALLQHFKGWIIETESAFFDPERATLMDFRVSQKEGTTFVYVLPLTERKALVEYTLFTEKCLTDSEYEAGLTAYIEDFLRPGPYQILEKESGIIPMTDRKFSFYKNGVFHIGTAGGQTKASSGYTFQFVQKRSEEIVQAMVERKDLRSLPSSPGRFGFYDAILLDLLVKRSPEGRDIFSRLFRKNKATTVFAFLDNETSLIQELSLFRTLQIPSFSAAAVKRLLPR